MKCLNSIPPYEVKNSIVLRVSPEYEVFANVSDEYGKVECRTRVAWNKGVWVLPYRRNWVHFHGNLLVMLTASICHCGKRKISFIFSHVASENAQCFWHWLTLCCSRYMSPAYDRKHCCQLHLWNVKMKRLVPLIGLKSTLKLRL